MCLQKLYRTIDHIILAPDTLKTREHNINLQVDIVLELFPDSKIEQTNVHERGGVHENQKKNMEDPTLFCTSKQFLTICNK